MERLKAVRMWGIFKEFRCQQIAVVHVYHPEMLSKAIYGLNVTV